MEQRQAGALNLEKEFACLDAQELQSRFPCFFSELRVPISDLTVALGLKIKERVDLRQRAQLEILTDGGARETAVIIQPGLDQNVRRFAIAHELGHYILLTKRSQFASGLGSQQRERFANTFAAELLLSTTAWARIESSFRLLSDPLDLLRLASTVGLSPHALLTRVTARRPLTSGLTKIWLRVKHAENAVTHSEPRLRIVSAHYDRERFYIPENQSVNRFAGGDTWLSSLPVGVPLRQKSTVAVKIRRSPDSMPRYLSTQFRAEISAVRLPPSTKDQNSAFIVLANIERSPEQGAE